MGVTSQADRLISVTTPLGPDVLLLHGFTGSERLSAPFVYHLDLLADEDEAGKVDPMNLIGKPMTVKLQLEDGKPRHFNGIVRRFSQGDPDFRFHTYRAEVVPKLWLLTLKTNTRIFQQMTIPDILKKVLTGVDVDYQLTGKYEAWDYCAQYRETDFNFVSRLMEEEGIFYFFKHTDGQHKMVIADSNQAFADNPHQSEIRYAPAVGHGRDDEDAITNWEGSKQMRSGKNTLWDHCFELPGKNLEATTPTMHAVGGNDKLEVYDYPGGYSKRFDGITSGGGEQAGSLQKIFSENKAISKIRMQEEESTHEQYYASSMVRGLMPGSKFSLSGHQSQDGSYVLTSVEHVAAQSPDYVSNKLLHNPYSNSFTCIKSGSVYRPPRAARKPFVQGLQTAVVTGPAGQEIFTDKYGRVKVQFPWDREGKNDENSSCWLRVSQPWAGKQWGAVFLPRIGHEVVVAYLEGDPDQPIIIGSVYNADNMPPYALPANMTQSGVKTRSTLGGSPDNFNELRFEDKKGDEHIYFHAEKNFDRHVENDDREYIGHDQLNTIQNHRTEFVKDGNETIVIEAGNRSITVGKGNQTTEIKQGNREATIGMGNDTLSIKMGNQTTKLDLGKSETEAMQSIELKVGQSSVKLDQMGVTIKGMMIKIEGQIMVDIKGLILKEAGTALVQIQGGITLIN